MHLQDKQLDIQKLEYIVLLSLVLSKLTSNAVILWHVPITSSNPLIASVAVSASSLTMVLTSATCHKNISYR